MDNGYGQVFCVQMQLFDLTNIHEYFKECIDSDDKRFDLDKPFVNVDSVINFLNNNWLQLVDTAIMTDLDITDILENFHSTCNPNGFGNSVDCLVVIYNDEILFESKFF